MESSAISSKNIDEIQKTIHQFIESKQSSATETSMGNDGDGERRLLVKLLSQLETMKEDEITNQNELSVEPKEVPSGRASEEETKSRDESEVSKKNTAVEAEDVVKELKKLNKQNRTTHWLLSALIVLTIAWQVSEVSLLLKLKSGFSNPFKSLGKMFTGMVKRRAFQEEEANESSVLAKVNGRETSENPLKLPSMDIAGLINGDGE
ncbi:uncharacterized protein LOC110690536 [Chenopodium quinoa]|uniref:uncharacterized protein LOC110690536 n=1 Tax=Chenopodium quinoa TaxID=63459 RepID=UPI000B7719B3|nr:uncharacterized protein LOC110690536 [Chenopodium quinoa]